MISLPGCPQTAFKTAPAGSRHGQFAGERYDRDAAGPAALGTDALAEPTAESTVRLVSDPHPRKLDHRGTQPWIASLRDGRCCHSSMGWGAKTLGEELWAVDRVSYRNTAEANKPKASQIAAHSPREGTVRLVQKTPAPTSDWGCVSRSIAPRAVRLRSRRFPQNFAVHQFPCSDGARFARCDASAGAASRHPPRVPERARRDPNRLWLLQDAAPPRPRASVCATFTRIC